MRYTDLFITVDTHVAPENEAERERITAVLTRAIRKFLSAAVLKVVILCEDASRLRRVVPSGGAVELGDKYGRVHAHFNLSIGHETNVYLKHPDGRTLNTVIADWFDNELRPDTGKACYVRASLAESSRAKNYAAKSSNTAGATSVSGPAVADFGINPRGPRTVAEN